METFGGAFPRVFVKAIAKPRLLPVIQLYDPLYGRLRRIIGLVICIRIIIGRDIPGRRAANTEVQYLQGDDPEK
jgi:hypothetical protein